MTIILVTPARVENIGATARAMKTMGFTQLHTVDNEAHLEPTTQWVMRGSGDITDNINVFSTLADALHSVDFTIAATTRGRAKFHYYATPVELVPLLQKKSTWMEHVVLVFGREGSRLTDEGLVLADILTGVPMVTDYPSLNLGQAVMMCCYQLVGLVQQPAKNTEVAGELQLQALRIHVLHLLATLNVSDGIKLTDWLQQRVGLLGQRDMAMLHHFLHNIEKNITK